MLIWWIDELIGPKPQSVWYRYHVAGRVEDIENVEWNDRNAHDYSWSVPNLENGGGRFVFRLREVR